jgi:integrase
MAKGKGLYKRGNIWWLRYAGPDGRVHYESARTTDFEEAENLLIDRRKEIKDGKDPVPVKQMQNFYFRDLDEPYREWAERQKGVRSKKAIVQILVGYFGNIPLRHFNPRIIEAYQTRMLSGGKAPATCNRHLATLKHMITKAVEWEMTTEDVLKKVRKVKLLPENNRRLRYLNVKESQELIQACPAHLKPIVIMALNTGMRKEEILSLKWEKHIDLKHNFILLDQTKNGDRREIPINGTVREVLTRLVKRTKPVIDFKTGDSLESPYVFVDANGERFKDVKRSFRSACRKAGIKDFRFHDLRHTFASHLVMAGIDITTVKDLLGHKTLTMTLRYAHLAPSHRVKAVDILDQTLNEKPTIQKVYNVAACR